MTDGAPLPRVVAVVVRGLFLSAVVECDEGGPTPKTALELGTGTDFFEPLDEGDRVWVVFGPQGGYHLDGSLRALGIEAGDPERPDQTDNPLVWFRVFDGGLQLANQSLRMGLFPVAGADGVYEWVGEQVILSIASDQEVAGRELLFEVELQDAAGNVLVDRRAVMAEPHPLNQAGYSTR